ncbi:DUF1491 family protein [Erythrobacter sp. A6_0]|uniref:DUF1491 family protein n=1 Tax=Erythrobacter sp. A6_0 TaxID=2821089 RepID=UPI001ADB9836|nr:DUF1491 family protein [Erythrobacter sp. A6_0]MBO9511925.1 DUF1491 family protein [Erythrobacter sp. A6_0]
MSDNRLPAHVEIAGMIRSVQAAGGFATVLHKGERDAGAICVIATHNGHNSTLWERMPQLDGSRKFVATKTQDTENKTDFEEYLARRLRQDPDSWQIELDIENAERFIAV